MLRENPSRDSGALPLLSELAVTPRVPYQASGSWRAFQGRRTWPYSMGVIRNRVSVLSPITVGEVAFEPLPLMEGERWNSCLERKPELKPPETRRRALPKNHGCTSTTSSLADVVADFVVLPDFPPPDCAAV